MMVNVTRSLVFGFESLACFEFRKNSGTLIVSGQTKDRA